MGYIKGSDRSQGLLLPQTLDDYVADNNAVRAIAAFLERLDFVKLGFVRAQAAETGRPGYDPRLLMGLYLWGHLNGLCSSRKLARECQRNLEVIWLCENLQPDFKTVADFRTANAVGIKGVLGEFRRWCMAAGLYGKEIVAVDGSKFKAVNSKQRNYTGGKLKRLLARERAKINEYLEAMDAADAAEAEEEERELTAEQLKEKIAGLERYLAEHEQLAQELEESGENQISLTDPDAKLMKTSSGSEVSYNVQTVVDSKLKLLVTYEVTNASNDLGQLAAMAQAAQQALEVEELTVLADGGYYEGNALKECEEAGLHTYVPEPQSGVARHRGVFG
jgi:transposase